MIISTSFECYGRQMDVDKTLFMNDGDIKRQSYFVLVSFR